MSKEKLKVLVWQGPNTKTKGGRPQRWRIRLTGGNEKKLLWGESYTNQGDAVDTAVLAFKGTGHRLVVIDSTGAVLEERTL